MNIWAGKLTGWLALAAIISSNAPAATFYVDANGANPVAPYGGWDTAATNIQDAAALAGPGSTVWVTNGVYQYGSYSASGNNRVYIFNNVTVQSVNGPAVTTILGYQVPGTTNGANSVRGVYLSGGAILSGFTLTNGSTTLYGGGVFCQSTSALVTNCVIAGNSSASLGGGAYSGTLVNCILSGNIIPGPGNGGGADNSALINCLLTGNQSGYYGGGAAYGTLINCTVVSNTAVSSSAGAIAYSTAKNCIIYYNSPDNGGTGTYGSTFTACCTFPMPSSGNNLTNPPAFVNSAAGDFHLSPTSPCVNAGSNAFVTVSTDLDGNPRIVAGVVDLGAYESPYSSGVHFVSLTSTNPVSPFTAWSIAATNIQDAVDASTNGDVVLVSDGLYQFGGRAVNGYALTNRVAVTRPLTLASVNGPALTFIQGRSPMGGSAVRCVYLTNGAALIGFTLTNGATLSSGNDTYESSGGGILCESTKAVATNCVIVGCSASVGGGGSVGGTLNKCTMLRNSAGYGGGIMGVSSAWTSIGGITNLINSCIIASNVATSFGGGAFGCSLNNCFISSNSARLYEGGGAAYGTLNSCIVSNNSASAYHGGGVSESSLTNCLIVRNIGGEGGGAYYCILDNCSVVSNSANNGGGTYLGTNLNSIVYGNSAYNQPNYFGGSLASCDTAPMPSGFGNLTNDPVFLNPAGGDFHLQSNSPCINAGNNAFVTGTNDLDGDPRIVGGTVDIGAYEYQTPCSILSYAWAQQYGLPTDGSADYMDFDGTGMNNWEKWIAGLDPTNPASVLALLTPAATNNAAGVTVIWQSVNTRAYYLQRATDLTMQPAFSAIQSNLVGQAGTTSFTDTTATNNGPFFYRVGVQ